MAPGRSAREAARLTSARANGRGGASAERVSTGVRVTGAADRAAAGLHRRCRRSTRGLLQQGWAAHRTRRPRPRPRPRRHEGARSRATRARRACCRHPSLPSVPLSAPSLSQHSTRAQDMRARWHPSVSQRWLTDARRPRSARPSSVSAARATTPGRAQCRAAAPSAAAAAGAAPAKGGSAASVRVAVHAHAQPGRVGATALPTADPTAVAGLGRLRVGSAQVKRVGHSSVGVGLRASGERGGD